MSQKVFIPVTDELLYERPDLITSPLLPFHVDHPCFRWLSVETEAIDPATVDVDISVELQVASTALNWAPIEREDQETTPVLPQHALGHILRRQKRPESLPCKDAA